MRRGIATFTLDTGHCPPYLWQRMVKLGREMVEMLVLELGPDEFIRRVSDPVWFQSLGTVLAFDWNASGLTTILTASLKESIRGRERELGVFICGGKGATSRKTPAEINTWADRLGMPDDAANSLVYNSKMAAKVDSSLVQDGFDLYHHAFFFSRSGAWTVIQQGMNTDSGRARRYHWHSENVHDLVQEPHAAIVSAGKSTTLDLTAAASARTREVSVELVHHGYWKLMKDIQLLRKFSSPLNQSATFKNRQGDLFTLLNMEGREFHTHPVVKERFDRSKYLEKILGKLTERAPQSYEKLLAIEGVGAKTVRALALVGEVIYGAAPSYQDPARYSFAHGGKDGTPFPVDRATYDRTIAILARAVRRTRLAASEKSAMLRRLEA
jgi:uncharacterized protein